MNEFHFAVRMCRQMPKGTVSELKFRMNGQTDRTVFVPNGSDDNFVFYYWADWEDNTVKFHYDEPARFGVVAQCSSFEEAMQVAEEHALATSLKY